MHRRALPVLVASAVTVGLVGLAGPAAVANDNQQHPRKKQPLMLYATETASTPISAAGEVDAPEEEFGVGGRFLSVDTLYSDAARTQRVGRNDINCDIVEVTGTSEEDFGASLLCSGVIRLDGQGSLAWQTAVSFGPEEEEAGGPFATVAITGGTGAFKAAGGQAVLFDESPEPAEGEDEDAEGETLTRYEVELLQFKAQRH